MRLFKTTLAATVAALAAMPVVAAHADDVKPAVVYDLGGKNDKSFNEGVFHGAQAFTKKTGIAVKDFEPKNAAQIEQALRQLASKGYSPVLGVGFDQADAIKKVAAEFPKTKFVIIDSIVDAPNVQSVTFKEHESSYLAGVLAAMTTKSGKIGFVGGMDIPLIHRFACGYQQGAASVNRKIAVTVNYTGTTPAAWNDPVKGGELAKSQLESGVDIIYQAAGGTGVGVLQTVADAGKLGIGVDSNQDEMHPGHMLTSVLKEVGVAANDSFTEAQKGTWKAGVSTLGLKEKGVGLAFDSENAPLLPAGAKEKLKAIEAAIASGKTVVHDYTTDSACPL